MPFTNDPTTGVPLQTGTPSGGGGLALKAQAIAFNAHLKATANAHPQSAVVGLVADLAAIVSALAGVGDNVSAVAGDVADLDAAAAAHAAATTAHGATAANTAGRIVSRGPGGGFAAGPVEAAGAWLGPTGFDPSFVVRRPAGVAPFFAAARGRRVDIALVGDSNLFNASNSGLYLGFARAWGKLLGQYATGVKPACVTGSYGIEFGAGNGSYGGDGPPPAPFDVYNAPAAVGSDPLWLPTTAASYQFKMGWDFSTLYAAHPNGITGKLRWHFDYATWAAGTHTINACMRNVGGLSYPVIKPTIDANTGTNGVARTYVELAAGARASGGIIGQYQVHFSSDTPFNAGDLASWWNRWEWADITAGVSVSNLCYQGGLGTLAHAQMLQGMTQAAFTHWARMVVIAQGATPTLMVQIISGQNDGSDGGGGDSTASVGPSPTASNTPAGVVDNTAAIVARLRTLWVGAGYDVANLYFMVGPYHPQDYSRPAWSSSLDAALSAYADSESNLSVVSRKNIATSAYFTSRSWYAEAYPGDAHLTNLAGGGGYEGWAELAARAALDLIGSALSVAGTARATRFVGQGACPTGAVLPYGGATPPAGWLACDGATVSRATYADLFAAIGTAFGAGDGTTTFSVPDLRGRYPVGGGPDAVPVGTAAGSSEYGPSFADADNNADDQRVTLMSNYSGPPSLYIAFIVKT